MLIKSLGAIALAALATPSHSATAQDQAVVQPLGGGTVGAGGIPQVGYYGAPVVGRPFALRIEGGAPFSFGAMALSASAAPVDLPAFGATVHPLAPYVALEVLALDESGRSVGIFPVTSIDPSLVGVEVWAQGVIADGAAVGGLAFTDARRFFFGEARAEAFNTQLLPDALATRFALFADVDADGNPDVVQFTSTGLLTRLGNGDGTFQAAVVSAFDGSAVNDVLAFDANGDTHLDLVAGIHGGLAQHRIAIMFGDGAGAFTLAQSHPTAEPVFDLEAGDVNSDGWLDVGFASPIYRGGEGPTSQSELTVLMGSAAGQFTPGWSDNGPWTNYYQLFFEDLDLDGDLDIVANGATSIVHLGANDGTFSIGPTPPDHTSTNISGVGDLSGDGVPDLVAFDFPDQILLMQGVGDGSFVAPVQIGTSSNSKINMVVDFDGDGDLDIVAGVDAAWSARLNDGTGTFESVALGSTEGGLFARSPDRFPAADLDGDGRLSILTRIPDVGAVIQEWNGDGRFQSAPLLVQSPQGAARDWSVADMDGDGRVDLIGRSSGSNLALHLGRPGGRFAASVLVDAGLNVREIAVTDLNGDGMLDVVAGEGATTSTGRTDVAVLLSTAPGVFGAPTLYPAGWSSGAVACADFDGDGVTDVAAVGEATGELTVFLGVGDGTLVQASAGFTTGFPVTLDAYDATGDGVVDLVSFARGVDAIVVLAGHGDGSFDPPVGTHVGPKGAQVSMVLLEVDGDGIRDAAVFDPTGLQVVLLTGDGAGGFSAFQDFQLDSEPHAVGVADVDRDGRTDLLIAGGRYSDPTMFLVAQGQPDGTFGDATVVHTEPTATVFPSSFFDADLDGLVDVLFTRSSSLYLLKSGLYR